ncbi:MAG: hypothetical protein IPQ07_17935 [Myxococcales bacterium]|nr:hypothetical protein [Myxococcales bacterium]
MGHEGALTTSAVLRQTRAPQDLPLTTEAAILTALTRPIDPGEGHREGNARRERELAALFSQLELVQAFDLGRRFDLARADDRLAQAFARLVVDRRQRLRAFLADARRRQALGSR